jgi:hypothetical protein
MADTEVTRDEALLWLNGDVGGPAAVYVEVGRGRLHGGRAQLQGWHAAPLE